MNNKLQKHIKLAELKNIYDKFIIAAKESRRRNNAIWDKEELKKLAAKSMRKIRPVQIQLFFMVTK